MIWLYISLAFVGGCWFGVAVMAVFQVNKEDDDER